MIRTEVVDLLRADAATCARVRRDVLAVQQQVYRSVEGCAESAAQRVARYVDGMMDTARYHRFARVVLCYDGTRAVACGMGTAEVVTTAGRQVEVVRGGTNVVESHRAGGLVSTLTLRLVSAYLRRYAWSPHPRYYLGHCMSPVTYHVVARRASNLHPSPTPCSPEIAETYAALVGHGPRPVREVVGSRVDARTEAWLARSDSPHVRYFLSANPRFRGGWALPLLVRLDTETFARSLHRSLCSRLRRWISVARAWL